MAVGARRESREGDAAREFGIEKYMSVPATPDGNHVVATVADPSAGLWSVPILTDGVAEETDVKPFPLSTAQSSAPRYGAGHAVLSVVARGR